MSQKNIKIFVENARAIARTAKVGEDIYETAKERGIEIIADDIPNLFALKPRPVETFVRLVTLAVYQLERDLIVERLTKGLALAKKRSKRTTQFGEAKVNGTKSHLEKKAPTKKQMKQLRQVIKKQKRGKISWRQTQADFRSVLRKPKLGIDTVRRMIGELELKHFWKGQRSWCMLLMSCFTPCLLHVANACPIRRKNRKTQTQVSASEATILLFGSCFGEYKKKVHIFQFSKPKNAIFPQFLVCSETGGFWFGLSFRNGFRNTFWPLILQLEPCFSRMTNDQWPYYLNHWPHYWMSHVWVEWPNPAGTSACSCSRQWRGRPARQCPEHQRPKTKDHSSISPVENLGQDQTLYCLHDQGLLEPAPRSNRGVHPNKTFPKNCYMEPCFFGATTNTPATGKTASIPLKFGPPPKPFISGLTCKKHCVFFWP